MAAMAAAQTSEQKKQEQISTLEEIVVTAQKRAENLQEVPIAVTALTS
jgi:iron complex outermembrane receptor protein